ncbi:MAG: DsbA family protein [Myxococcota bacterium]
MKPFVTIALAAGLAMGTLACQPGGEELKRISEQQEEILQKLRTLESNQKRLLSPAAAARAQRPQEDPNKVYKIDIGDSPILGKPDAPVTIVEYSDFQCPYCARTQPLLKQLHEKYPDKVRIVFKHFPLSFHQGARPAAIASMAAKEQGKFWEMHDVLFENHRSLNPSNMEEMAKKAGLDLERFKKDMEEKAQDYAKQVDADFRQGQTVAVRGTPTLFVNGKKVQNRSVEGMSAMIDAALKQSTKGS